MQLAWRLQMLSWGDAERPLPGAAARLSVYRWSRKKAAICHLEPIREQAAGKRPASRYLRQREYPQPPPPSTTNTTRTINKVSMSQYLLVWFSPSRVESGRNGA